MVDEALRNISKRMTKSTYAEWKLNQRFNTRFVKRAGIAVQLGNYIFPSFISSLRNNGRRETPWIVAPNHSGSCSSVRMFQRWIEFGIFQIFTFSREKNAFVVSLIFALLFASFFLRMERTGGIGTRIFYPFDDESSIWSALPRDAMNYAKITQSSSIFATSHMCACNECLILDVNAQ
jgi:hypothetical protein